MIANRRGAFTFVEMLAAMAFLGILIPVVVSALLVSNRAAVVAERSTIAMQLGENRLDEMMLADALDLRGSRGDFGDDRPGYRWELKKADWETSAMTELTLDVFFKCKAASTRCGCARWSPKRLTQPEARNRLPARLHADRTVMAMAACAVILAAIYGIFSQAVHLRDEATERAAMSGCRRARRVLRNDLRNALVSGGKLAATLQGSRTAPERELSRLSEIHYDHRADRIATLTTTRRDHAGSADDLQQVEYYVVTDPAAERSGKPGCWCARSSAICSRRCARRDRRAAAAGV